MLFLTTVHNDREKKRQATLIIGMNGATTEIKDPSNMKETKRFAFDYSYWSHDQFKTRDDGYLEPTSSKFADQVRHNIVVGVLRCQYFQGHHACTL